MHVSKYQCSLVHSSHTQSMEVGGDSNKSRLGSSICAFAHMRIVLKSRVLVHLAYIANYLRHAYVRTIRKNVCVS